MIDRKNPPKYHIPQKFNIIKALEKKLDNGVPVYEINTGKQDVVKISFDFRAGAIYSKNPMVAELANSLLTEGTSDLTSWEIAEKFDFYGAFVTTDVGRRIANITITTLNKHIEPIVELVYSIITKASFEKKEIDTYLLNEYQEFLIEEGTDTNIAFKELIKNVYSKNNPYSILLEKKHFKNIKRKDIINFHKEYYNFSSLNIIVAGKISNEHISILNKYFGKEPVNYKNVKPEPYFETEPKAVITKYIEKKDAVQSTIMFGKISINRKNPDYFKFAITEIILGGYFGSRLMKNIREDKGYTYDIYSQSVSMLNFGFQYVFAQTGIDVCDKTVEEIKKELKILRTELISQKELVSVQNYLAGAWSLSFDSISDHIQSLKNINDFDLGYDYYDKFLHVLKNITPEEIRQTAEKYLHEDSLTLVIVGPKKKKER